jgi:hypothetical protein
MKMAVSVAVAVVIVILIGGVAALAMWDLPAPVKLAEIAGSPRRCPPHPYGWQRSCF